MRYRSSLNTALIPLHDASRAAEFFCGAKSQPLVEPNGFHVPYKYTQEHRQICLSEALFDDSGADSAVSVLRQYVKIVDFHFSLCRRKAIPGRFLPVASNADVLVDLVYQFSPHPGQNLVAIDGGRILVSVDQFPIEIEYSLNIFRRRFFIAKVHNEYAPNKDKKQSVAITNCFLWSE